jgi:hypothetical protein
MTTFRDHMRTLRPDVVRRQEANTEKRALACDLIALRWQAAMSDDEVASASGLSLESVRRIESLAGPLPSPDDIALYRSACVRA